MAMCVMGQQATAAVVRPGISPARGGAGDVKAPAGRVAFGSRRRSGKWAAMKVAVREARYEVVIDEERQRPAAVRKQRDPFKLFVGLPHDCVSECNTLKHARAISAGLKALKLLGADGVELPIFWGVVQSDSPESFNWSAYLELANMVRDSGLSLRITLHLDASSEPYIPLPKWVIQMTESDPDLLFTNRAGRRNASCLSFAVDEQPVLGSRTPLQAYDSFYKSFRSTFCDFFGSTITDVTIGLGPNGYLQYPSFPRSATCSGEFTGVGEFTCYDKYMLAQLKQHAEASRNPLWGLGGPHDAPQYNQSPDDGNFFKDHGGSWETDYGKFFLSWYSSSLLAHGDRVLSVASHTFNNLPLKVWAKVPLMHAWHNTRPRPAQLTAGFYNTDGRDGYDAVAEMFARYRCGMVIPGMDFTYRTQPNWLRSSPEALLAQIRSACNKHGVRVSGENSLLLEQQSSAFDRIKDCLSAKNDSRMDSFVYQRMGVQFFSPQHFPWFTEFVRSLEQPELESDDFVRNDAATISLLSSSLQEKEREMHAV